MEQGSPRWRRYHLARAQALVNRLQEPHHQQPPSQRPPPTREDAVESPQALVASWAGVLLDVVSGAPSEVLTEIRGVLVQALRIVDSRIAVHAQIDDPRGADDGDGDEDERSRHDPRHQRRRTTTVESASGAPAAASGASGSA